MRSLSLALILCAATAMADSFGPELPFVPHAAGEELATFAITSNGVTALWNSGQSVAARGTWRQPIDTSRVMTLGPAHRDGAVASIGDESLVSWVENDWIWSLPLDANGQPTAERTMIQMVDSRHTSSMVVAASSSTYLIVWQQLSSLLGTLVDAHGKALTWQTFLMEGPYGRDIDKIAVASDGTDFLVIWESSTDEPWVTTCGVGCASKDREIWAIVVGSDGKPRPQSQILLATNAAMPEVVWTGSDYLALWTALPNGGLAGRHISASGVPGTLQTYTATSDWAPSIARDSAGIDVAYARLRPDQMTELRALRINPDGTLTSLASDPLLLGAFARQFALAANGSKVALAYTSWGEIKVRYLEGSNAPTRSRAVRH